MAEKRSWTLVLQFETDEPDTKVEYAAQQVMHRLGTEHHFEIKGGQVNWFKSIPLQSPSPSGASDPPSA